MVSPRYRCLKRTAVSAIGDRLFNRAVQGRGPTSQGVPMQKFISSFIYAWHGVRAAWRDEQNFRVEVAIGAMALALAIWLDVSLYPVLVACGFVLAAELMNSAIEALVDLISPDRRPLAKKAKDVAAAAVLIASVTAAAVGVVHLGPPLLERLFGA